MRKLLLSLSFVGLTIIANAQWQPTGLDSDHVECLAINGNNIFAGTIEDGVYLSTNNGSSWTAINNGLTSSCISSIVVKGDSIFAVSGGVFLSTNNGGNWTKMNIFLTDTLVTALAVSGNKIFTGTNDDGVFMSSNGGSSWTAVNNGLPDSLSITSLFISDSNIFAGTYFHGMYLSSNNGNTWDSVYTGIPTHVCVESFTKNGNNIFAGTNIGVYLSTNNGSSWTAVNTGIYNMDLNIYTLITYGDTVFVGTNNNGSGVYFSSNNGNNWQATGYGFSLWLNIYSLAINENYIFAGTEGGVWILPLSEMGIKELKNNENNIAVYPNPAKDKLTIESLQNATIEILNIQGQTILQQQLQQGTTNIDISGLAKGLYILRLSSSDKTEVTRFVKE